MMRKHHSPQFKTKIVPAILSGEKELNAVCTENNLNPNMVRKWKQEFLENAHNIFDTKMQNKKTTRKEQELSVRRQCELLSVNRTSIYYKPVEHDEKKITWEEEVMREIDNIHNEMPYIGSRKIVVKLTEKQFKVTRRIVRRLMGKMCLCAIYPKPNLSKMDFKSATVPYLLRNYNVIMPNQVWSIDITYIKYNCSHLYLTAIIDWFGRKIMGWTLSDTLDTSVVIHTVRDAVEKYGIPAIINSDKGVQFTSKEYKELLKELGIRQSMDGRSRWADNIMIERWFRSFKTEEIYSNEYSSVRELKDAITRYVNDYNTQRPHESLDYYVPDDYFYGKYRNATGKLSNQHA